MTNETIYLPGYHITEQLYVGSRTIVYRGVRESDRRPVVLKLLRNEYPSFGELVQFRNQYVIAKNLEISGVIQPLALEVNCNGYVLVMEDIGGIALANYLKGLSTSCLPITDFLEIALQLTNILSRLYRDRVIHKDLKPANILICPNTKQVKLIDFSIASLLPRETQEIQNPNFLEGTLAYISPEQTGRMNRGIDYRTDFYALGVTFYQLLTGQLPFPVDDPMELLHCHLAKQPNLPHQINSEIPPILSQLVLKLMAKNAEDRYQSALGLKHDLEQCLHQWTQKGKIECFELGQQDITDRFLIPEKLYGRQAEVLLLLEAFHRVTTGSTEMMLVAGFSGIGKTAVVNEVHKPIVRQRGYFIKGKYDQFQRNIPFVAFVQAFRDLMGQLLSESDAQLTEWKHKILKALGENGQVIVEVIPELERIIGQQPPVLELSGSAAQNRFNLLFQKFVRVFASAEHPLVVFLDDLQWADSASLKLLQVLMTDTRYLLIIGAYRDNEVETRGGAALHPFVLTVDELQKAGVKVQTITLKPLLQSHINQLVADTLSCHENVAQPLTELLYQKTKGNPFFTTQFLKLLYENGSIFFDYEVRQWQCDLSKVRSLALTDDVVDFMAIQLQKLPLKTQQMLKLAACIGAHFDLKTLAIVSKQSPEETASALWKALQEGFILPTSKIYKFFQKESRFNTQEYLETELRALDSGLLAINYKFLHDRVQQAAYFLIPETEKRSTHFQIGQLLLQNLLPEAQEEHIFELVNQLNWGTTLITEQSERDELARLNLLASRKAKNETAYSVAGDYAALGIQLLGTDGWHRHYEMMLNLHDLAAEVAYLCGDLERMKQFIDAVIQFANNLFDRVKVYEIQLLAYASQNQFLEAIATACQTLQMFGVELPQEPKSEDIQQALLEVTELIQDKKIEELIHLPVMTDAEALIIMQIAASTIPAVYLSGSPLFALIVALQIKLSIQYGNTPLSAYSYACYGILVNNILKDTPSAAQFGQLALKTIAKFDDKSIKPETFVTLGTGIIHCTFHLQEAVSLLQEGYQTAIETGNLDYAGYNGHMLCLCSYWLGQPLDALEPKFRFYSKELLNLKQVTTSNYCRIYWQTALNLLNRREAPFSLSGEALNEATFLPQLLASKDFFGLHFFYLHKLHLCILLGDIVQALENAEQAKQYLMAGGGTIGEPTLYFYESLAILANEQLQCVEENQAKLERWAHQAPMNFLHKYCLVEAERHRVLGNKAAAIDYYDRAIALAKKNNYLNEEALANELTAKFYLNWSKEKVARSYMIEAYYCYARWGAKAKVMDLEKHYPQLLAPILQKPLALLTTTESWSKSLQTLTSITHILESTSANTSVSDLLDLASVIKAAQTLYSEIQLERLLETLMQLVIENAGADKAALIFNTDGELKIAAQYVDGSACSPSATSINECQDLPLSIIYFVKNTQETVISTPSSDPYLEEHQPQSFLCTPILNQGKLIGILYLENSVIHGAFTSDRVELLKLLCSQAAISLENAHLYQQSQNYAQQLEVTLEELKQAQLQTIQSEKMSALGNLVAGVAHEINNPIGFLAGNIQPAQDGLRDLFGLIDLYQQEYPNPSTIIQDEIEAIDLGYLREDLPKLFDSMKEGVNRIRYISHSLRTFSRADSDRPTAFNIHEGLDSTIMILKHRLKANESRPAIEVVKNYGQLPQVECYAGQLNQVFMNLLANAIDALEEANQGLSFDEIKANPNRIIVITELSSDGQQVRVRIQDNGIGMSDLVKEKIFDRLYTTKGVGKGTGLGLAIARQIIVEKHNGTIHVNSSPKRGAEFAIAIPIKAS
ncbi:AAA family ATPase [Scytonema sp. NUACC21]